MTAKIPQIHIYNKKTANNTGSGNAGKIACIGAFDSEESNPVLFTNVTDALGTMGDDSTFDGCACLPYLFMNGADSVLIVNTTTWSGDTPTKTIDTTALTTALTKIKGEDWDILFIAAPLTDAFITLIDTYLDATFEMKYPSGYIGALTGVNDAANIASAGLAGEHVYGLLTQSLTVNDNTLSVLLSSAYYTGLIAGMSVRNTMTMKTLPNVTGVTPELSFETGGSGKALLEAGITTIKCANRNSNRYVVVNSEQPNGFDLYVNRVRDYVIKALSLHDFLGERNNELTLSLIKFEVERIKNECVDTLDLLKDIEYIVTKKNATCAEIHISKLLFDGIITEINVYVTVEVE